MSGALLDPPTRLPVDHLSVSSIRMFLQCPEKWRRRYLEREYEPFSGAALLGSAVGAAEGANYQQKIDSGEDISEADVLDAFAEEFDLRAQEDVDWGGEKPGQVKDQGARVLPLYHRLVAPTVTPKAVERQFTLRPDGVEWSVTGFIDVEERDDGLTDVKVKGKSLSQADADHDPQATLYLLAKRSEGEPAPEFRFHPLVKAKAPEPKHVQPVVTTRTDAQLDAFVVRLYNVAAEMAWRVENEVWDGAPPGAWWCGERWCGFWASCPYGGAR